MANASKYEDSDRVKFSCEKITGIKTVSVTKVEDQTLELKISSGLSDGMAKIAVIRDDLILEYIDFGEEIILSYNVAGEHTYRVKILCEDAKLEITVERSVSGGNE